MLNKIRQFWKKVYVSGLRLWVAIITTHSLIGHRVQLSSSCPIKMSYQTIKNTLMFLSWQWLEQRSNYTWYIDWFTIPLLVTSWSDQNSIGEYINIKCCWIRSTLVKTIFSVKKKLLVKMFGSHLFLRNYFKDSFRIFKPLARTFVLWTKL